MRFYQLSSKNPKIIQLELPIEVQISTTNGKNYFLRQNTIIKLNSSIQINLYV